MRSESGLGNLRLARGTIGGVAVGRAAEWTAEEGACAMGRAWQGETRAVGDEKTWERGPERRGGGRERVD